MNTISASFPLSSLNKDLDFKEILQTFPTETYTRENYILREGETPRCILYIEKGKALSLAKYDKETKELAIGCYLAEQFVNLTAIADRQKNKQSVKAIGKTIVRKIPIFEFYALMRKNPYINQLVLNSLARELEVRNQQYYKNITLHSKQRVMAFLLDQIKYIGIKVGYEWVIKDFFTQSEIAQLTNTARQTVNTIMNELRRKNIIHFRYKYFILRDLDALEEMVNIDLPV